jgi:hypothetical protein
VGSNVRVGPGELIEFCGNYPGPFGIQSEAPLGGLRNFCAMFIPEWGSVRNGMDIRDGVAGLGIACEYDATRAVFGAVRWRSNHLVVVASSFRGDFHRVECSKVFVGRVRKRASRADPGFVAAAILQRTAALRRPGHDWSL